MTPLPSPTNAVGQLIDFLPADVRTFLAGVASLVVGSTSTGGLPPAANYILMGLGSILLGVHGWHTTKAAVAAKAVTAPWQTKGTT